MRHWRDAFGRTATSQGQIVTANPIGPGSMPYHVILDDGSTVDEWAARHRYTETTR